jgi:hypothetical protein
MLCKAIYGRLSTNLPATLEAVIDGSVKSGANLEPVKKWNKMAAQRMVAHGRQNSQYAIPAALRARLPEWLRGSACLAEGHWLDNLVAAMELHKAQYVAEVEALAAEACPPLVVFEQGRDWLHIGRDLRQVYANVLREASAIVAFDEILGCEDENDAEKQAAAPAPPSSTKPAPPAKPSCSNGRPTNGIWFSWARWPTSTPTVRRKRARPCATAFCGS